MSDSTSLDIESAFRRILRPLVRIMLRAGVQHVEFSEIAKEVFIDMAFRDRTGARVPQSLERVALATGVTRSEVAAFVKALSEPRIRPRTNSAALTEILNKWHTNSEFTGPYGVPIDLPIESKKDRSFAALVRASDPTLSVGILLEQLLNAGIVQRVGDDHVKVLSRTYVVDDPLSPEMLEYFGNAMTDLATTIQHNMASEAPAKRLERSVFADHGLRPGQLPAFEKFARARVQQLIVDVDNWLANESKRDGTHEEGEVVDVGINVFQYVRSRADDASVKEALGERSDLT